VENSTLQILLHYSERAKDLTYKLDRTNKEKHNQTCLNNRKKRKKKNK
jgi:hypothetical protein